MTGIEWTNKTWNPTTDCDRVPDTLDQPLRWKKPRRVFVNSMSDLFHDGVSDEFIERVFASMAMGSQHTYQVLTKRHGRMRSLLSNPTFERNVRLKVEYHGDVYARTIANWPLPNVWIGVTVENQQWADIRIPALLDTPAAVRFLSCEPLLGPVDLNGPVDEYGGRASLTYWLYGRPRWGGPQAHGAYTAVTHPLIVGPRIDWVIVGGESGQGARPMPLEWVRTIVAQCQDAAVPVFVKQLGSVWADDNGWGGKGGLPEQWPADLRVREYPRKGTLS